MDGDALEQCLMWHAIDKKEDGSYLDSVEQLSR